ncbi:MKL2 [Cordylochernes scorpioides]|uniref:MKL2 n=1 Tax=Cordylochernes scorpioides TaxID=51811 RepID=A0ABY6KR11_9ARAC|nr:MKL2 [Cordylochernes scorpioides]
MVLCPENKQEEQPHQKYWGISLDQDLVETIFSLYPEWLEEAAMSTDHQQLLLLGGSVVDQSSLDMGRNKESLKLRLMLRRPITQLVEQGIIPYGGPAETQDPEAAGQTTAHQAAHPGRHQRGPQPTGQTETAQEGPAS